MTAICNFNHHVSNQAHGLALSFAPEAPCESRRPEAFDIFKISSRRANEMWGDGVLVPKTKEALRHCLKGSDSADSIYRVSGADSNENVERLWREGKDRRSTASRETRYFFGGPDVWVAKFLPTSLHIRFGYRHVDYPAYLRERCIEIQNSEEVIRNKLSPGPLFSPGAASPDAITKERLDSLIQRMGEIFVKLGEFMREYASMARPTPPLNEALASMAPYVSNEGGVVDACDPAELDSVPVIAQVITEKSGE